MPCTDEVHLYASLTLRLAVTGHVAPPGLHRGRCPLIAPQEGSVMGALSRLPYRLFAGMLGLIFRRAFLALLLLSPLACANSSPSVPGMYGH
jgi:hypothetical protein